MQTPQQQNLSYPIPYSIPYLNPHLQSQAPQATQYPIPYLNPHTQSQQSQKVQPALPVPKVLQPQLSYPILHPQVVPKLPVPQVTPQLSIPYSQPKVPQYPNPFQPQVPYIPPQPKRTYIYHTALWGEIHQKAKEATTLPLKNDFVTFLNDIISSHGCGGCAQDLKNFIAQNKIELYFWIQESHLGKNFDIGLFKWSWMFHNHVNKKLKRPEPTFEEIVKKYYS